MGTGGPEDEVVLAYTALAALEKESRAQTLDGLVCRAVRSM